MITQCLISIAYATSVKKLIIENLNPGEKLKNPNEKLKNPNEKLNSNKLCEFCKAAKKQNSGLNFIKLINCYADVTLGFVVNNGNRNLKV